MSALQVAGIALGSLYIIGAINAVVSYHRWWAAAVSLPFGLFYWWLTYRAGRRIR